MALLAALAASAPEEEAATHEASPSSNCRHEDDVDSDNSDSCKMMT